MVEVLSRFKVANGREESVREAFLNRPRLVDNTPGFLGLEVFTEAADRSVFYLVTRWSDVESFQDWHSSPAHQKSHRFIPKGLKLDASFTQITYLERISAGEQVLGVESALDAAPVLAQFVERSSAVHWIRAALDGAIIANNAAVSALAGRSDGTLAGTSVYTLLTGPDAALLRTIVEVRTRVPDQRHLFNFVGSSGHPRTLACHVDVQPDGILIIGEPVQNDEAKLGQELMDLNNRLAVLVRENERKAKALAAANRKLESTLQELNQSYWHLRKIQEVLPICMECGKVKTGDAKWEAVVDYLKANTLFLSHGYCPDCIVRVREVMLNYPIRGDSPD